MFLAKIKFALLACGLIATGALVVAQQARMITPEIDSPGCKSGRSRKSPGPLSGHSMMTPPWQGSWANSTSTS